MTNLALKNLLKPLALALCSAFALLTALPATAQSAQQAAVQPRITAPIENSSRVTLHGTRPLRANPAFYVGAVAPSMQLQGMSLAFGRTAAQQTALDTLIAGQQNPASPLYHQWLTPAQFGAQFGVADADLAAVQSWLEQQGFTVDSIPASRNRIDFSGTAGQVAAAFNAPLHYYQTPAIGDQPATTHFAPSTDISIPSALASSVIAVNNLSSFRPRPHVRPNPTVRPQYTVAGNQYYFLTPLDVETIYDIKPAYSQGYNGSGLTIAVVGQSQIVSSDITTFQTLLGLPAKAPGIFLVPNTGTSAISAGDESESDLDLEYSSALAPGATVNFYYAGNSKTTNVINALQYVIDNNSAPIVSISYGDCELDTTAASIKSFDTVLAQAATQGQSVIASAGDDGSTDCAPDTNLTTAQQQSLGVDYPASSPYVTAMGGTEFLSSDVTPVNTTYWTSDPGKTDLVNSAISYIPETTWNDDAANVAAGVAAGQSPLSSGGGGASLYETRPTWQTGVPGIPAGTTRLVPDISLDASPNNASYLYCTSDTSVWAKASPASGSTPALPAQNGSCVNNTFYDPAGTTGYLYYDLAGGTSFDAPIFSGLLAVINQATNNAKGQGVVNPTLYTLASNAATYASAFHDITTGGNECDAGTTYCGTGSQTSEFRATVGYDEATGIGSLDFYKLLTAWPGNTVSPIGTTSSPTFSVAATAVSVTSGASANGTITITPANGYTGTVNLAISPSTIPNGCITITPSVSITGTTAATATYTVDTSSATCTTTGATSGARSVHILNLGAHHTAALHHPSGPSPWKTLPVPASLASVLLFACFRRRSRLLRATLSLGLLLVFVCAGIGLTGCSGGTSTSTTTSAATNTAAGTYSFKITGTDSTTSSIANSTSVTVTVN